MIAVLVNPRAGVARDPRLHDRLRQLLREGGVAPDNLVVSVGREALEGELAGLLQRAPRALAVCGGDGTLSAVADALCAIRARSPSPSVKGDLPPLAPLRGGTVNTIAANLGVRGRPEALLRALLRRLVVDSVQRSGAPGIGTPLPSRPASLVRVHWDDQPARHGFLFAAAMGARFLDTYYQQAPGLLSAALLTLRTTVSTAVAGPLARRLFAETPAELQVAAAPDEPLRPVPLGGLRLFLASTVPDVGMGMRVTWRGGRDPGRFHVVASRLPLGAMALQLPRVLAGRPLAGRADQHLDQPAARAVLRFAAPEPCTLDGDLFRASELDLCAGPTLVMLPLCG